MYNVIRVYEAVNTIVDRRSHKERSTKTDDRKLVFRSKGAASDDRKTGNDKVEACDVMYTEEQEELVKINGTPIFRVYCKEPWYFTPWFFTEEEAINKFNEEKENDKDFWEKRSSENGVEFKVQIAFLDTTYIRPNKFPMDVVIKEYPKNGSVELGVEINMCPEVNGVVHSKPKMFWIDKSWTNACIGLATINITKEYHTYGYITGIVKKLSGVTEADLKAFCKKVPVIASSEIFKVNHPLRGEYFYCKVDSNRGRNTSRIFVIRKKGNNVVYDTRLNDMVMKDVEQYGSEPVKLY